MMTFDVQSWWFCLTAIAVLNVSIWCATAYSLRRRRDTLPAEIHRIRLIQLGLSAAYVLGCGFRSVLPVYDVPRVVMLDTWLSSVAMGRSVATVAELCFVAQLAVMLHEFARATGSHYARRVSWFVVPLIAVAEVCSWYSVLTTDNIGHVIEESLWGLTAALMVTGLIAMRARVTQTMRYILDGSCSIGTAYVAYMLLVDVPRYFERWVADEAVGRAYLTIESGLVDVASRWTVSHSWQLWHGEMIWMTLYFSVAVWFSVALIHAPHAVANAEPTTPPRAALGHRITAA